MIDWDRVAQLREEIGTSDFDEVVEMFLDETDEVIDRLRAGAPYPTLEAELHFLKGSALNLGLRQLAGLCDAGEKLAAGGGQVDLATVIHSYAASRQAFGKGLQGLDAA
jgi:histidine phosphotransfer protein HptB